MVGKPAGDRTARVVGERATGGPEGGLEAEVAALRQSLDLMLETQATHTEMLRQLLQAAAAPLPGEDSLSDTLAKMAMALTKSSNTLVAVREVLERLPADVGTAVAQAMRDVLPRG